MCRRRLRLELREAEARYVLEGIRVALDTRFSRAPDQAVDGGVISQALVTIDRPISNSERRFRGTRDMFNALGFEGFGFVIMCVLRLRCMTISNNSSAPRVHSV